MSISAPLVLLLFATGLFAGVVDTIAGGGGLITIPVLLGIGVPPAFALGTNKLQASFGSGSATLHFWRQGAVTLEECATGIALTFLGSALGTLSVQRLDPDFLRRLIPFLLAAVALYVFLNPAFGRTPGRPLLAPFPFYLLAGLGLGFYDGFFGPGTGSFWVVALMAGLGQAMPKATATTKVMNFTSNIASLVFFWLQGHVLVAPAAAMAAGQFLGGRIGARLVMSRGVRLIRPAFLAMVAVVVAKLAYDAWFGALAGR
ncbi:MAG: TSUP family transporter [Acidobacteriota bacterium]